MTLLAYGCVRAGEHGWGDAVTLSAVAGAVLAGLAFVGWELRADAPLIRLSVLRIRSVWVAVVIVAFLGATAVAGFYFLSLFLQNVLRYGPLATGAAFLPFTAGTAAATKASSSLVERFGTRVVLAVGLTVGAAGMLGFARLDVGAGYTAFLLASIPTSIGLGACIAPTLSLGAAGALTQEAGMVSGLLNSSRQLAGSIALAALATVASQASHAAGVGLDALADGYRTAFLVTGALLLTAAAVALVFVPRDAMSAEGGSSYDPVHKMRGQQPAAAPTTIQETA